MDIDFRFDLDKTVQSAAFLLKLARGKLGCRALVELLYYADRLMLVRVGRVITGDQMISTLQGPALRRTRDLVLGKLSEEVWSRYISAPEGDEVALKREAPTEDLSQRETSYLEEEFRYREYKPDIGAKCALPEMVGKDLQSEQPITYEEVLRGSGVEEEVIECIREDQAELAFFADIGKRD